MNNIRNIKLINFRNIEKLSLDFDEKLNVITGRNGIGKTNILDAIFYLSSVRSNSNATDQMLVRGGCDFFRLEGNFDIGAKSEVVLKYKIDQVKSIELNGKTYPKFSEHIGKIPVIFICPDDIDLIKGTSETRRKFLDYTLSLIDYEYLQRLIVYNRLLRQRNALLKSDNPDIRLLTHYDQLMDVSSRYIFLKRKELIDELNPVFQEYYCSISRFDNNVALEFTSDLTEMSYLEWAERNRREDVLNKRTKSGVHKDDVALELDGRNVRKTGSQGQMKSFLLALKFAQYNIVKEHLQKKPILLLDDLFDRLDVERVGNITKMVLSDDFGQVFITDTNANRIQDLVKGRELAECYFDMAAILGE